MFDTYEDELNFRYFKDFKSFWYPIYKRQIFKLKCLNDTTSLLEIKENINQNVHLQDYKFVIFKELGILSLEIRGI